VKAFRHTPFPFFSDCAVVLIRQVGIFTGYFYCIVSRPWKRYHPDMAIYPHLTFECNMSIFPNICSESLVSGTYKLKKTNLQHASFYPVKDEQVFYWNQEIRQYSILSEEVLDAIRHERFARL
jgi:hypothetical protein